MTNITRHISSDNPRVMVVDGSRVARKLVAQLLEKELPGVTVIACGSGADAQRELQAGVIDLITTALRLPDMDGLELARYVREHAPQAYIPIVAVSGDVQERLVNRALGEDVTDYFDKAQGLPALAEFIRGYVRPEPQGSGEVLYVEDSRVVALATRRMLEKYGLKVTHVISAEDAVALLDAARAEDRLGTDLVLTDVNLKGELSGGDLLARIRNDYGYGKGRLPVLVMTGDDNPPSAPEPVPPCALLRAGANDLVQKPIEERLLVTKLLFQLRVARRLRAQAVNV